MKARTVALLVLLTAVAALSALLTRRLSEQPARAATLSVRVDGHEARLPAGTTLAGAAETLGLAPRPGELLDLGGKALRPDGEPGRLLLDGRPARGSTLLMSGERIAVLDGRDRREPLVRAVVRLPGGSPSDPQFTLSLAAGEELLLRGAVSHELASAGFKPTGSTVVPRAVALTFDDGPSPEYTPRILATLRRLGVRATFFVIGYLAAEFPELVREEQRLGMEVGNHSYNHPDVPPFNTLPTSLIRDEITLDATILTRIGVRPRFFRPPGGTFSATVVKAAAALGERVVLWSVDPTDWTPGISSRQVVHNVLSAIHPGSIVILHDGGGDRSATLAALPAIVRGIRARGLRLVALTPGPLVSARSSAG